MSITGFLRARVRGVQNACARRAVLRQPAPLDFPRADWARSLIDPNGFYLDCFRFFHTRLAEELRAHRAYFLQARRGFGEDAFHTMWFLLFREFRPANFLEIGVYRGQTLSLFALLARLQNITCAVNGISPFSSAGDSVSNYSRNVDYLADTLANFAHFSLPQPKLLKAFSTDPAALDLIRSQTWQAVYIDGNHDYAVAKSDWEACAASVAPGGIIVLDDSGLTTTYQPSRFATGGHPGPSRLAQEIDRARFWEILQVGHNRVFQKIA